MDVDMGKPSKSRRIEHITPIMIQVYAEYMTGSSGLTEAERRALYEFDPIRQADIASIRRFVESHCDLLRGRVLDFGAGKPGTCRQPQPYRDLVDGTYLPVDEGDWLPPVPF